jgi:hypothetical protein
MTPRDRPVLESLRTTSHTQSIVYFITRFFQIVAVERSTLLHAATLENWLEVLETLMQVNDERKKQLGFNIDARESAGRTPFVANRPRFGFYSLARIAQLARRQLSYFS